MTRFGQLTAIRLDDAAGQTDTPAVAHEHNAPAPADAVEVSPDPASKEAEAAPTPAAPSAEGEPPRKRPSKARGKDRERGRDRDKPRGKDRGRGPDRDRGRGPDRGSSSPLKAGLFASIADKHMPCRVDGCTRTWTWSGVDQMRSLGQAPPQRMCDEHLAEFNELRDREIECRNPGCGNTWTWKRGAQLFQLQKHEKLKPPSRLCASCFEAEKSLADTEIGCRIPGCARTWTWTKDAQQKHRAWLRRLAAKQEAGDEPDRPARGTEGPASVPGAVEGSTADAGAESEGNASGLSGAQTAEATEGAEAIEPASTPAGEGPDKKRRRKKNRRKKRKLPEGPPEKMCGPCAAKLSTLEPREEPCKVHGCTRTWTWSKEHQLRAWIALGPDAGDRQPVAPKRMCVTCRDFCRERPDKPVPCGRPGCGNSWTWKTGAQLQAHLAGKTQDPIRLCDTCAKGEFLLAKSGTSGLPPGAEIMPCVVPACGGTWTYLPGMALAGAREGDLPTDRMCDKCRAERDLAARSLFPAEAEPAGDAATGEAATGDAATGVEGNSVEGNSVEENSDAENSVEENSSEAELVDETASTGDVTTSPAVEAAAGAPDDASEAAAVSDVAPEDDA